MLVSNEEVEAAMKRCEEMLAAVDTTTPIDENTDINRMDPIKIAKQIDPHGLSRDVTLIIHITMKYGSNLDDIRATAPKNAVVALEHLIKKYGIVPKAKVSTDVTMSRVLYTYPAHAALHRARCPREYHDDGIPSKLNFIFRFPGAVALLEDDDVNLYAEWHVQFISGNFKDQPPKVLRKLSDHDTNIVLSNREWVLLHKRLFHIGLVDLKLKYVPGRGIFPIKRKSILPIPD